MNDAERISMEGAEELLSQLASAWPAALFARGTSPIPQAPAEQAAMAARYQALIEQIPAVIFMAFLDQDLSEAYVSPHVETALGFSQEEWLNDPVRWFNQIHPEDRARWSVEAAQFIMTGQPLRSVYRVLSRDRRVVWFQCEVKIVTNDGRPWFIHGTAFDITALKESEVALQSARDELDVKVRERTAELTQANADLELFAHSASHDFEEPLRSVAIYVQMLRRRCMDSLDTRAAEYLQQIGLGIHRMQQLLSNLRIFLQASTADNDTEPQTDASVSLRSALANLEATIHISGASVTSGALPSVRMRPFQMEQLFQNLISNAIHYRSEQPPRIHIAAEKCGNSWRFSVSDNGIGIDSRYKDQIFGLFKRLHPAAERPGSGMGLAICKRIIERNRGEIWMESQPGKGSTFFFTVPGLSIPKRIGQADATAAGR